MDKKWKWSYNFLKFGQKVEVGKSIEIKLNINLEQSMPRLKKKELNLKQYKDKENNRENERNENIRRALIFVIALLYCGFPESLSQDFSILIGDHPPTYYFLHLALEMINPIVQKLVANSTAKAREEMPEKATACMDGSWDHKQDRKLLIYDIICIETQKIIDFVLIIRKSEKKQGNTTV
ncbi:hypothetical protein M9Y10_034862 [Tritrichomonas musculus]|uniref:Uncharacterized protein n=1 Tax=Tritrichomonas musculus TaxID=1915356 RepID=A0ABR2KI49_9EUKA